MPSTHLSLHYHLIWSTKERRQLITDLWRDRLHAYLGGVVRRLGGTPDTIGGTPDHVHLLIGLRATHCLADVVRDVKKASSEWVHDEIKMQDFHWQDGYGGFTVSASLVPQVRANAAGQMEHHRKKTFQEEYREFLEKSGVEFDEKYLW